MYSNWLLEGLIFAVPGSRSLWKWWAVYVFGLSPRLLEVISCKIFAIQREVALLDCLSSAGTKMFRIEEIPKDEVNLAADELLIPVAHFHKVNFKTNYGCYLVCVFDTVGGMIRHTLNNDTLSAVSS